MIYAVISGERRRSRRLEHRERARSGGLRLAWKRQGLPGSCNFIGTAGQTGCFRKFLDENRR